MFTSTTMGEDYKEDLFWIELRRDNDWPEREIEVLKKVRYEIVERPDIPEDCKGEVIIEPRFARIVFRTADPDYGFSSIRGPVKTLLDALTDRAEDLGDRDHCALAKAAQAAN